MTTLDYTFERQLTLEREENIREGREEGRAEGREEGRTEGIAEGLAKGREEGRTEGRERERIDAILRMLKVGTAEEQILAFGYSQNEIAFAKEQATI